MVLRRIKMKIISNGPKVDKKAYSHSVEAIQCSLRNRSNKNIGIIGDFGSGKSSAIETFCHANKFNFNLFTRRKIVKISLSEFYKINKTSDKELQCNIVQQLMYSTPKCIIPRSNYIKHGFKFGYLWLIILFVFFAFSLFYCIKPDFFSFLNFAFQNVFWLIPFGTLLLFIISFPFVFNISSLKTKIKDVEVEASFTKNDIDPLDFYLDEIVYYFKKTYTNLVIFEDIDRCDNCDILFTKLRLLNNILNNMPCKKFRKQVVFMHAIKEDIFENLEQKSKYFDTLIPIKPIFSQNSSLDHLFNLIPNAEELFSQNFIERVSPYFIYMRQMNNVVNAFNILRVSFDNNLELFNNEKLFAVILYKSMFPADYILALKGKGILCFLRSNGIDEINSLTYDSFDKATKYHDNFSIDKTNLDDGKEKNEKNTNKKETQLFNEIKSYVQDFIDFLQPDAFNLISTFPGNKFSNSDAQFIHSLNYRTNENYINRHFDDPLEIVNNKIYLDHCETESCCNIELFYYLFSDNNKIHFQEKFIHAFEEKSIIRNKFVLTLLDQFSNETDEKKRTIILNFLEQVLLHINFLSLFEKNGPKVSISFNQITIFMQSLTKENFPIQNADNTLVNYLNVNESCLLLLARVNDTIFNLIKNNSAFCMKYCGYKKEYFSSIVEDRALFLIDNHKFQVTKDNLLFLSQFLNGNSFSASALSNIYHHSKELLNYFVSACNTNNNDIFLLLDDFSNEEACSIKDIFVSKKYTLSGVKKFLSTCPIFDFEDFSFSDWSLFLEFFSSGKLTISLNHCLIFWPQFTKEQQDLFAASSVRFYKNIRKELLKPESFDILASILNYKDCTNDVSGKILLNTTELKNLDSSLIKSDTPAFRVALFYGYFILDSSLIDFINSHKNYYEDFKHGTYCEDIINTDVVYNLTYDVALLIASDINDTNKLKDFLVRYKNITFNRIYDFSKFISESNILEFSADCINIYLESGPLFDAMNQNLTMICGNYLSQDMAEKKFLEFMGSESKITLEKNDWSIFLKNKFNKSKVIKPHAGVNKISFTKLAK